MRRFDISDLLPHEVRKEGPTSNLAPLNMAAFQAPSAGGFIAPNDTGGTDGNVAEILVYDRVLNTAERIVTDNYLAAKWDRTIANDRYQYDAGGIDYDRDVFGVGRFDASNLFDNTKSAGLRIDATGGGLSANNEWILAGHNVANNSILTTGLPSGLTQRWDRVWAVDQTSADGVSASLTFDFSEAGLAAPSPGDAWVLLYSATLPTGAAHPFQLLGYPVSVVGDAYTYSLSTANLLDGYYTLGLIAQVPEPSTLLLTAVGIVGLARFRRRRTGS